MSYQVLARKYRPQKFSEVIGQEHVTQTLKNALEQGRTAHGYLQRPPRHRKNDRGAHSGHGAQLPLIDKPVTEPCGVCESCTEIRAGNAVDVIEIDAPPTVASTRFANYAMAPDIAPRATASKSTSLTKPTRSPMPLSMRC